MPERCACCTKLLSSVTAGVMGGPGVALCRQCRAGFPNCRHDNIPGLVRVPEIPNDYETCKRCEWFGPPGSLADGCPCCKDIPQGVMPNDEGTT